MRKIYFAILSLLSLFFWSTKSTAQVSTYYTFSQSSGVYTAITGGTIVATATDNNTAAGSLDDAIYNLPTGTIPFTFIFNSTGYTGLNISSNGFVTFGATAPTSTTYTPISSTTAYNGAIAAFGGDINSIFNLASTTGEIRYEVVGSAPTREFVIQWKNYRPAFSTSTTSAFVFDFQVRLGEDGVIKTMYGGNLAFIIGSTTQSGTRQIGLRGSANTDFNNRTSAAGILFTASTAGTLNTSTQAFNTTTIPPGMPTTGLTYTWNPPPPCIAPPGGGTTNGPSGVVCPGSVTLTVTGASTGTGLTYQWESSADNVSWNPIAGATGQSLVTAVVINTYYRRQITCSSQSSSSTSFLVTVSALATTPFTENFSTYTTLFPPTCWSNNNATYIFGQPSSAFGVGVGSAKFDFYNASTGTVLDLGTAVFNPVPANYRVTFDHAYATFTTQVDQLQVLYSTDGGVNYSSLATYLGGTAGPLNTFGGTGATTSQFAPTAAQWASKAINLPVGTNKVLFRGISAFGNNLFIDNITVEPIPPCLPPTGLTVSALTTTTATLSWTASASAPTGGYQWEVRTSGAGGSGAAGLVTSGVTAAGITTANATGLTANTAYSYYVRSNCGLGVFSIWAGPFAFTTPCNPFATPFTETFATYATTFPPTCWTVNDPTYLTGQAASAYGIGSGSAKFDFYFASSGTNIDLTSPPFAPVPAGYRLTFDHAYATFTTQVDQLQIFYSTDGGVTYTSLITYLGGTGGPLNTAGAGGLFTPSASQWIDKAVDLPVGTNMLRFRGVSAFGNNLFLDNITVEPTPSCFPVSAVNALAVLPTSVIVSFTPPATTPTVQYIVEYGAPGFTPGTTNAPGAGGTIVTGPGSPITVNGLTANSTYDFYVRKECIAGVDFSINRKATATTLCAALNVPYIQNFDATAPPAIPTCTSIQDLNGAPTWATITAPAAWGFEGNSLRYLYSATKPANDWFFIQGLNLTAGTLYELSFKYGSTDPLYPERMKVAFGTSATSSAMVNTIVDFPNIIANSAAPFANKVRYSFTPTTTGINYLGFQVYSLADEYQLFLDSIYVKAIPPVDVGIASLTLPSLNCPTNGVIVQATVKNYNLIPVNFATYPVTVTANITGAGTATLTALLNSGTLAPGATQSVSLSPAFNFSPGGTYNITTTTSTSPPGSDPETANDSYSTSVIVNPSPLTPVITPSAPAICLGNPVLLNTQFTVTPPTITWTPVTGLYTNAGATTAYISGSNAFSLYANPAATTTYTVTATTTAGCTASATATVTVNPNPVITVGSIPDTVCISDPIIPLIASPVGGSWSGVGVSGTNFVPPATAVGTYILTYSYTNAFGCPATATKKIVVKDCPQRVILLRDNAVILYPNPNKGQFNIRINSVLYNKLGMRVYSNNGTLVNTQEFGGLAWGRVVSIDLTNLPGGLYMVKFYYEGGPRTSEKTFNVMIGH